MMTSTQLIVDHLEAVRAAIAQAGSPVKAWTLLLDTCPEIAAGTTLSTFTTTAPIVLATAARLTTSPPTPEPVPKNFMGWTVSVDVGYLRLYRRIDGRLRSVYIGKVWNEARALERITSVEQAFEAAAGPPRP
jgi:hypothetical protein